MATSVVVAEGAPTGLVLTLKLYVTGDDNIKNGAGDAFTEETNRLGYYKATVTEALDGSHYCVIVDGSANLIATGWVMLSDTTDTFIIEGQRQHHLWDKMNVVGKAAAGTLSTTQMTTDLTETTDDHYQGKLIYWTSGVLLGQFSGVTSYTGATNLLVFNATTDAPSAGDTFILV